MINKNRIIANFGASFFTALAACQVAGITDTKSFIAAFLSATITGGFAACQEYKKETEQEGEKPPKFKSKESVKTLPALTLF